MNNILNSLKKIVKNKNTVTIVGVILIVGILYWGYNNQIKTQTEPQSVFVANETIQPRKLITDDLVKSIKVPKAAITDNVVRIKSQIVGKYTNYNTVIPAGSMFYKDVLVNEDDLPDASFVKVKEGDVLYNFPVTMDTTYGNAIMPGKRVDIYMKAVDSNGQIMVGKLIENVEVLAVKDRNGANVFENTAESRTPAYLIFGLEPKLNILLRKASYMSAFSVVLFPVPLGTTPEGGAGETQVSSQKLQDFINANTVANDEIIDENPEIDDDLDEDENELDPFGTGETNTGSGSGTGTIN